jgi:phosphoglycolate phosphatase
VTPAPLHIVFDWNGTLIDDLDLAVRSVNACAERFGLEPVDRERYRTTFGFPVRDFYAALGFDLGRIPFEEIVACYLATFDAAVADCPLHPGVAEGLERLSGLDEVTVSLLSASFEPTLQRTIASKRLGDRFDHVIGVANEHGASKLEQARRLAAEVPAERTVLVGDTSHDIDIAADCGWEAHAVACGHQSRARLTALGAAIWHDPDDFLLNEVPRLLRTDQAELL